MNLHDARSLFIQEFRSYLSEHYSNTPKLAITMDCTGRIADIILYIHRTDDTWHTVVLNVSEVSFGVRGSVIKDRWEGWIISQDEAQPLRSAPNREEINRMHRLRDIIASEKCLPWQSVSAYVLFPANDDPFQSLEWYSNMELLGVGALPYEIQGKNNISTNFINQQLSNQIY